MPRTRPLAFALGLALPLAWVPDARAFEVAVEVADLNCYGGPGEVIETAVALIEGAGHTVTVVSAADIDTPEEIGPDRAAQLCEELGVRVYAIAAGVGKRVGPGGSFQPIDTTQIRRLAERTGGRFFEARDGAAIGEVYATIDRMEKVQFEEPRYELRERFLPFLALGLSLLFAGRLLRASTLEVLP